MARTKTRSGPATSKPSSAPSLAWRPMALSNQMCMTGVVRVGETDERAGEDDVFAVDEVAGDE